MGVSLKVEAKITSNTKTAAKVTATVWAVSNYGSYNNEKQSGTLVIGGTKYSFSATYKSNQKTKIAEKSKTIEKTTKSQKISVEAVFNSGTSSGKVSGSDSVVVKALESFTVSYSASGATGIPGKQTKWYGKPLTLSSSVPKKTGYVFNNWRGSNGSNYSPGGKYTGNTNLTLTAQWTSTTYTITFKNGSQTIKTITKEKGTYLISTLCASPSASGYKFLGWSDTNNNVKKYSAGQAITITGNLTLYAVFQAVQQTRYDGPELFINNSFRCRSTGEESLNGRSYKIVLGWEDSAITKSNESIIGQYRLWMTINGEDFEQDSTFEVVSDDIEWDITNENWFYPTSAAANNKSIELIIRQKDNTDGFLVDETYNIEIYMLDIRNTSYTVEDSDGGTSTISIPEEQRTDQATAVVPKGSYIMHFDPEQLSAGIFSIADKERAIQIYNDNFQLEQNGNMTVGNAITANSGTILNNLNISGQLSAGSLNGNLFTMTSNSKIKSCAKNDNGSDTITVTAPSGYFPISIASVNVTGDGVSGATAPTWLNLYAYFFTSRQNGRADVKIKYRNTHTSTAFYGKIAIYVLWFKLYT